jgi:Tfp pilus assembly protein PilE
VGELTPPYAQLSREFMYSFPSYVESGAKAEAQRGLLRTALTLERYRAERGAYPSDLEALGSRLPSDPYSGALFVYRRDGTGFVLETVPRPKNRPPITLKRTD